MRRKRSQRRKEPQVPFRRTVALIAVLMAIVTGIGIWRANAELDFKDVLLAVMALGNIALAIVSLEKEK